MKYGLVSLFYALYEATCEFTFVATRSFAERPLSGYIVGWLIASLLSSRPPLAIRLIGFYRSPIVSLDKFISTFPWHSLQQQHLAGTHKSFVTRHRSGINPIHVHSGSHRVSAQALSIPHRL